MRPIKGTYPAYYENYIPLVKQENINNALAETWKEVLNFFKGLPASKVEHAYAPGKWTIKQILNHLSDTERVMTYRALRFARKDPQQPLAFEQDDYVANADLKGRNLDDLLQEFESVRKSSISLYKTFSETVLHHTGRTTAGETTVLALGYLTCGHALHHMNVVRERY